MDKQKLNQLEDIIYKYGKYLREHDTSTVQLKDGFKDIVTECDAYVEKHLVEELTQLLPGSSVIGEEGTKELTNLTWIIDPIDGTTNFANMHAFFTISIALYKDYKPVFGYIYDVMQDKLYSAFTDGGAYINKQRILPKQPRTNKHEMIFAANQRFIQNNPKIQAMIPEIRAHRIYGSATLEIIMVALGQLDLYGSSNVKVWDYAAANIFLKELGGVSYIERDFFTTQKTKAIFTLNKDLLKEVS